MMLGACTGQGGSRTLRAGGCDGEAPATPDCRPVCRAVLPAEMIGGIPVVTAWIDGRPVSLIFDTGANVTFVTPATAQSLGLPPPLLATGGLIGIGGQQVNQVIPGRRLEIRSLDHPGVDLSDINVHVARFGPLGTGYQGTLGTDVIGRYDLDLDMPHRAIRLYDHASCVGLPPGWLDAGVTLPFAAGFEPPRPAAVVSLEHRSATALIDTGAGESMVSLRFARSLGILQAELDSEIDIRSAGIGSAIVSGRRHLFHDLVIGNEVSSTIEADVDPVRLPNLSMLLGEDFLATHRVWLSFSRSEMRVAARW